MDHTANSLTPTFVGIDVAKDRLDVHLRPSQEAFVVARDPQGFAQLLQRLAGQQVALIVLEATGSYSVSVAAALAGANLAVVVVNPRQVRDFARAVGCLAKTDSVDAQVLSLFAERVRPEPRALPDQQTQLLAELVTRRRQLWEMIVAEENRCSALISPKLRKRVARHVAALRRELEELDQDTDSTVRSSPLWRERENLLCSMPGIGKQTARMLMAELPELGTLSRRKIASLVGLAPFSRDSGKFRGRRMIRGGRTAVRCALYMATLVASRWNPAVRESFLRLRQAGKPFKVALTAAMRKLLVILNAMVHHQLAWRAA
jgi:transposase